MQPLVLNALSIPKFSGDIRSFPMFRNRFLETVEGRKDLPPRQKFLYLLQHLADEPLREASSYMVTDANYFTVLDSLEERYGNKHLLIHALEQDLLHMKSPGQHAADLRRFHNEARRLVDEMRQAGEEVNGNSLWKKTLFNKLTPSMRLKISERLGSDLMDASIESFLTRLREYVRLVESSDLSFSWKPALSTAGNSGSGSRQCRPDPRSTAYRAETYATDADATYAATEKRRGCAYCGRDTHWASKCDIYATISQRLRRARQLDYCFLCLKGGHWTGTCPKKTDETCRFCHQGHHHQSLCRKAVPEGRRPFASLRRSPVRAPPSGILKKEPHGSSSSPQDARATDTVTPAGGHGAPPAKTVRLPSTQNSSTPCESNSKQHRPRKSKGQRTNPSGRAGTNSSDDRLCR
ncbi:Pao retrotransposon peptidase family protein [Aphelenchoides avenae]|nr:Pao retrotransposon peptidase family protein [Aphelenchus avenae]